MYRHLENFLAHEDDSAKRALAISHSANLAATLGLPSVAVVEANHPEHDVAALTFADQEFDFVLADQVLEHVAADPFRVLAECARVTRPGGYVVHTTCFFQFIHQTPLDFWRFTPNALRLLAESNDLEVVRLGGWGNRDAWSYMQMGYRMEKIPEEPGNPLYALALKNDKKYPITTWVIGRKPVTAES